MKCDLCKHDDVDSRSNLRLCKTCAEMIQRLTVVQKQIQTCEVRDLPSAPNAATPSRPKSGSQSWVLRRG